MLDPNYLLHISEGAENVAEQLHTEIVRRIVERIMLRIGRGDNYILTAQDKWQLENLQQAGYLLEDIQKEISKATKLQQTEIAEAMEEAGVKALDYDDKIYQQVGLSPTPLTQSPELIRLMQRNYSATMGEWTNFTRTMTGEAQKLFINELDKAYTLVSTGALSYTAAVKEVINNIASNGVTVTYPTGHADTIETATLRAVRTGVSQATAQIQLARMDEMNHDLVIVSSHLGARPSHAEWQGKIYSRTGTKYPHFQQSTGYGTVTGLCGANCRHSFGPYFEGADNPYEQYDSEENRIQYEKEQRQRTLERRIRDTKREVMAKKEAVDSCKDDKLKFELDMEYQRKAALLKKQNAAYNDYCQRNNLRPLSDRIQVAKWDRQQAAAARGAAKRYENAKFSHTLKNQDVQEYRPIERSESISTQFRGEKEISMRKIVNTTYAGDVYISDAVYLKPKEMHTIEKSINDALKLVGDSINLPKCMIISPDEMQTGAVCSYNAVKNIMYINSVVADAEKLLSLQKDMACPNNPLSTYVHEYIHWKDAQNYRKNAEIISQADYLKTLRVKCKKKLDELEREGYNIFEISQYAKDAYMREKYDETWTEYRVGQLLERRK